MRTEFVKSMRKVCDIQVRQNSSMVLKLLLYYTLMIVVFSITCAWNSQCDIKCQNKVCFYDPSTNSYYNSSLPLNPSNYNGQGCCTGCSSPYIYDHFFDPVAMSCTKGSCLVDNGSGQMVFNPGSYAYWYLNNTCLPNCLNDINVFANNLTGACEFNCSNGYYRHTPTDECLPDCPAGFYKNIESLYRSCVYDCSTYNKYSNNDTKFCESTCSSGYADPNTYTCVAACPSGYYKLASRNLCVPKAECSYYDGSYTNEVSRFCQSTCTSGFADSTTRTCAAACSSGYYKHTSSKSCVTPTGCSYYNSYINYASGFCQSTCPDNLYVDINQKACVFGCAYDFYKITFNRSYMSYPSGNACISKYDCNSYEGISQGYYLRALSFANNFTGTCDKICPETLYGQTVNGYCVENCPTNYYKNPVNKTCVDNCYNNGIKMFFNNDTGVCETACPEDQYQNTNTGKCVQSCMIGQFLYVAGSKKYCVTNCYNASLWQGNSPQTPIYKDELNWKCVGVYGCPYDSTEKVQRYGQNTTGRCDDMCQDGTYGHPELKICVSFCSGNYSWKNRVLKMCVQTEEESLKTYLTSSGSISVGEKYFVISQTTVIIIGVIAGGIVILIIGGVLLYKYYLRPRYMRLPFRPAEFIDIHFGR